MPKQLSDSIYQKITAFTDKGNQLQEEEKFEESNTSFRCAMALLPHPIEQWEATTWIYTGIGDNYFLMKNYQESLTNFAKAVQCPDGLGNYFIHLRLGECCFELGYTKKAIDELARAYMAGGEEAFETEDPKYFKFIKQYMK